jgi:hypothetical protein
MTSEKQGELILLPSGLRDQLQEFTETRDVSRHPILLEQLTKRLTNSIKCLSTSSGHLRYNCVMYALGIRDSAEYVRMAMQCPEHVHASTTFLRFLIDEQETTTAGVPSTGDMGVYFEGKTVKHVGRVMGGGRIHSKWGIGHLYDHSAEEAPSSYGSTVRFYKPIDPATALDQFARFAAIHG